MADDNHNRNNNDNGYVNNAAQFFFVKTNFTNIIHNALRQIRSHGINCPLEIRINNTMQKA